MPASQLETVDFQLPLATLQHLLQFGGVEPGKERRAEPRFTFSAPVRLRPRDHSRRPVRAFAREISRSGLGLVAESPLSIGDLYCLTIDHPGGPLLLEAQIVWCRAAGDGWHLAGCRFISETSPISTA
jgi:hypothetical protein